MKYFIHNVRTYSPANKKCAELCDFVLQFERVLIDDDEMLKKLVDAITKEIHRLNDKYRKSQPLIITTSLNRSYIAVNIGNSFGKNVCYIFWKDVRSIPFFTSLTINHINNILKKTVSKND